MTTRILIGQIALALLGAVFCAYANILEGPEAVLIGSFGLGTFLFAVIGAASTRNSTEA